MFTAKELDNETSYTYFGDRYYDSEMSVWLSVDPLSDKYPSLSPYCYTADNPVVLVDPRGMLDDWYRDDETGATFWHEGSESFIEIDGVRYRNIGATYSIRQGNVIYNYTQNEVTSMTFIGMDKSNFVSQSSSTGCKIACDQMLSKEGVNSNGPRINIVNADANGVATTANANATRGINAIDNALESGNPILVGVDYKLIQVNNIPPNGDGMTDHFIVISSKTETLDHGKVTSTTYNFFDPRTSNSANGTSSLNILQINNNKIIGYYLGGTASNIPYTVTTVRTNRE